MKLIKELSDMIEDELEGAEHYAECALVYKDDNPALAAVLMEISNQELHHVNLLHEEVVKVIKKYREKHGDPPPAMQAIYDWQHAKQVERTKEVRILHSQFRGA